MSKHLFGAAIAIIAIADVAAAMAADPPMLVVEPTPAGTAIISISGGIGVIGIEANELVYVAPGSPDNLSKLIWQSAAPVLTGGLEVRLPSGWIISANAAAAMSGDSYMEDYDWIAPNNVGFGPDGWSHRSQHPDTNLDWYFDGSILVGYDVAPSEDVVVNINIGGKYTDAKWSAFGGSFIYSNVTPRDTVGNFPDGTEVINYRQQYPAVIAGFDSEFKRGNWLFNLGAHGGVTFNAKDTDNHVLRSLRFIDTIDSAPILTASGKVSYAVGEHVSLFVGGSVDKIFLARGDTEIIDTVTNTTTGNVLDSAGMDFASASVTVGVTGHF